MLQTIPASFPLVPSCLHETYLGGRGNAAKVHKYRMGWAACFRDFSRWVFPGILQRYHINKVCGVQAGRFSSAWNPPIRCFRQLGSSLPNGARGTAGGGCTAPTFQSDLNEPLWLQRCQRENISSEVIPVNSTGTTQSIQLCSTWWGTVAWLLIYLKGKKTSNKNAARNLCDYQEMLTKGTAFSSVCNANNKSTIL